MTIEAFLARVYTDAAARARFLADPEAEARRAGLAAEDAERLAHVDREGLVLAAGSFAAKRGREACAAQATAPAGFVRRLLRRVRRRT